MRSPKNYQNHYVQNIDVGKIYQNQSFHVQFTSIIVQIEI
jgi:hypothetical protein